MARDRPADDTDLPDPDPYDQFLMAVLEWEGGRPPPAEPPDGEPDDPDG